MFLYKQSQIKFTRRNFKNLKFKYIYQKISNLFQNQNFIMLFYLNFFTKESEIELKNILKDHNLQTFWIKKNIFDSYNKFEKYSIFQNLMKNNTLIIYSKSNEIFNSSFYNILLPVKQITFFGIWMNKSFLRPSEYNFFEKNCIKNLQKNLISTFFLTKYFLKNTLSLKKCPQ